MRMREKGGALYSEMETQPSVTALRRWLYAAAILRFFSGEQTEFHRSNQIETCVAFGKHIMAYRTQGL